MQDVAELPAAEYVPAPQLTHVADEPEPETIFPAAVQLQDTAFVGTPSQVKPGLTTEQLPPPVKLNPVQHAELALKVPLVLLETIVCLFGTESTSQTKFI